MLPCSPGWTLYLVPDGLPAQGPYLVLQAALQSQGKAALGRITLSGHRHVALVRPTGRLLSMHLLHDPAKVRSFAALESGLREGAVSPEQERLATMLLDSITGTVDWDRYRDDTAEKLSALIEAKIAGQPCIAPAEEPVQVLQLLDALKQSVAEATGKAAAKLGSPARAECPAEVGMIAPFLPMLAVASEPFDSPEHLFEVKWDGVAQLPPSNREVIGSRAENWPTTVPATRNWKSSAGCRPERSWTGNWSCSSRAVPGWRPSCVGIS